jgi:hypothetical protein
LKVILLATALTVLAGTVLAKDQTPILGTSSAEVPSASAKGPVEPDVMVSIKVPLTFNNAGYGTGGVALRNRKLGVLNISGVTGKVQAAYLYWAYLFTQTPNATQPIVITRVNGSGATVSGTLLAVGGDPCWGSHGIAVYRAPVPLTVATGNGSYEVTLSAVQSALGTGEDPWDGHVVFPAAEGASLVIIGTGTYTVEIYDTAIPSGETFHASLSYSLTLPAKATHTSTLWNSISADGQIGHSRTATVGISGETTTINGVGIAGPGNPGADSDWDGSSGWPLPQLWDDTGHDITTATPDGTTTLKVSIAKSGGGILDDCISTIANVVAVK